MMQEGRGWGGDGRFQCKRGQNEAAHGLCEEQSDAHRGNLKKEWGCSGKAAWARPQL